MPETKKPLDILVVEDKESHLTDARAYFTPLEEKGLICIEYASTLAEAGPRMLQTRGRPQKKDGVLCDLFFPLGGSPDYQASRLRGIESLFRAIVDCDSFLTNRREQYFKDAEPWLKHQCPPPAGMYLAFRARRERIPIVGHTDVSGHGAMAVPPLIFMDYQRVNVIPIPDDGHIPQTHKPWNKIHDFLTKILNDPVYSRHY